jgi:hypothetical protein
MKYFVVKHENGHDIIDLKNFVKDNDAIKNVLYARLKIIYGELYYNTRIGVPIGSNKNEVDLYVTSTILNTEGINSIKSFDSSIDKNRKYSATIKISTIYNNEIVLNI